MTIEQQYAAAFEAIFESTDKLEEAIRLFSGLLEGDIVDILRGALSDLESASADAGEILSRRNRS